MSCPLPDRTLRETLGALPERFSTLDFIARCPNSGGDASGAGCPIVARGGGRSACGKRLGAFRDDHPGELLHLNPGRSPARWTHGGSVGASPPPVPPPKAPPDPVRAAQIRWKLEVAGVEDRGTHDGEPRDYLFPRAQWHLNLLPDWREAVCAELQRHGIEPRDFAHHVCSSQVFALNLAAPFFEAPARLTPLLRRLLGERVAEVLRVEPEVDGDTNYFAEPGRRGKLRTSADLGVWWRDAEGATRLLLIEVKFTERGFGHCALGGKTGGSCDDDGRAIVRSHGAACPHTARGRRYWPLVESLTPFELAEPPPGAPCPFRHGGYQLMRNQLLGAAMAADPAHDLDDVEQAVLIHDANQALDDDVRAWRDGLTRPEAFHVWRLSDWLDAAEGEDALCGWRNSLRARYLGEAPLRPGPGLRQGHIDVVEWMGGDSFRRIVEVHEDVTGLGGVYFRPTARGAVTIALVDEAPGFVGLRTSHNDAGYLLPVGAGVPSEAALARRWEAFLAWLPTVQRRSDEERGVIRWLRTTLQRRLLMPEVGEGWAFLVHEWRFLGAAGRGRKSDVLAVQLDTGRLGIVELKGPGARPRECEPQLYEYAGYWERDCLTLAPFFTRVLRVMGRLYDQPRAAGATVRPEPAQLFAGIASPTALRISPL